MKNNVGKYLLVLSILSLGLIVGCGGSQQQNVSQSLSDSPEPDFFGELSVDVGEVLPGTWSVQGTRKRPGFWSSGPEKMKSLSLGKTWIMWSS